MSLKPRFPITMQSTFSCLAHARMRAAGSPSVMIVAMFFTPFSSASVRAEFSIF